MLFWVFAAFLTLAAALAVMRPFLRGGTEPAAGSKHDLAVYRDQLSELEQEVKRGLISESDAAEARTEIGRRILKLTQSSSDDDGKEGQARGKLVRAVAMGAVLAVPVLSWGLYSLLGSPGMPAMPLQARLEQDPAQASLEELIARAEAYLAEHPQDARGWETLAPVYARIGRYADAVAAYRRTMELAGATADREAGLGEAMVGESGGVITADAEAAFNRALTLEEGNPRARFFIAMARAQEGNADEARAIWQDMASGLPEESPWKAAAGQALAGLSSAPAQVSPPDGPSEEQVAAAQEMAPEARQDMIEGMVASLDAKLRENPDDPEGWRRLVRSYAVLGRQSEAADALDRALAALGPETPEGRSVAQLAETLGIEGKQVKK
ncbi:c-type cytochrome biogenesis protein CcmI [Chelativorans sp. AA-79]|uniref:c-type cytochrome biogenesis protein CcmI n=1 Tax=Chelativorans sp. AA-79 TaxID=3028735 RepID=UPI0023F63875|nr:c-type cytochrome biogenesis protein CcmI [Chelativorans sp. AA-79]WEX07721.1 c-type cytochrome biogenesis protein CcmI [Chelativorans sp. AA-79]